MKNNALSVMVAEQDEKLEWERLIGPLWDNRWRIAAVTGLAGVLGVAYALLATPVYRPRRWCRWRSSCPAIRCCVKRWTARWGKVRRRRMR